MLINIRQEISRDDFIRILRASEKIGNIGLLVKRHDLNYSEKALSFHKRISPYVVKINESNKWPGTELLEGMATLIYFKINKEASAVLKKSVKSSNDFIAPNNFEDFCILRQDYTPWFISISHENEYYYNVCQREIETLHNYNIKITDSIDS